MTIHSGFQTFDFRQPSEIPKPLTFTTAEEALKWLERLRSEHPEMMSRFRELLAHHSWDSEIHRLTDHQTIERLALLIYSRKVVVLARESRAGGGKPQAASEAMAPPFPLTERKPRAAASANWKTKTWIAIALRDSDGNPVAGEDYKLKLPNGRTVTGKLDDQGAANVNGIDPGQCIVTFPRLAGSTWDLTGSRA